MTLALNGSLTSEGEFSVEVMVTGWGWMTPQLLFLLHHIKNSCTEVSFSLGLAVYSR